MVRETQFILSEWGVLFVRIVIQKSILIAEENCKELIKSWCPCVLHSIVIEMKSNSECRGEQNIQGSSFALNGKFGGHFPYNITIGAVRPVRVGFMVRIWDEISGLFVQKLTRKFSPTQLTVRTRGCWNSKWPSIVSKKTFEKKCPYLTSNHFVAKVIYIEVCSLEKEVLLWIFYAPLAEEF
jgi:hypothetical protein